MLKNDTTENRHPDTQVDNQKEKQRNLPIVNDNGKPNIFEWPQNYVCTKKKQYYLLSVHLKEQHYNLSHLIFNDN